MSKFLVIAEKPSVAQSYAKNLSAYKKEDGYLEGESCIISWCLGHLAEYIDIWDMENPMLIKLRNAQKSR